MIEFLFKNLAVDAKNHFNNNVSFNNNEDKSHLNYSKTTEVNKAATKNEKVRNYEDLHKNRIFLAQSGVDIKQDFKRISVGYKKDTKGQIGSENDKQGHETTNTDKHSENIDNLCFDNSSEYEPNSCAICPKSSILPMINPLANIEDECKFESLNELCGSLLSRESEFPCDIINQSLHYN